jgi:hypothetical protein
MDAMPNRTKTRRLGGLTLLLYQRTLHPEFFNILAQDKISRRGYEADIWLVDGGHVVSFSTGKQMLTEVIVVNPDSSILADRGLMQTVPCRGEKYHEVTVSNTIKYMISTQEEQLSQTLYDATKHEIASYASRKSLMTAEMPSTADSGGSLSVLDIDRRSNELLIQSFHLFDESLMVIKTQGIFELLKGNG